MLKKTIKYVDYNDEEREEDFYFNFTKAELAEMELSTTGGMEELIRRISSTKDMPKLVQIFKEIILKSYGEKSPDGKRFIKSKELSDAFSQTEAYAELFMELATDAEAAAAFVKGIVPSDIRKQIATE
jgi:hypothetical protein